MPLSSTQPREKKKVRVGGLDMAYVEAGSGDAIVLLHGNPTSSFLWRNVLPHLEGLGRLVVPDLIGMGDSDKLPESGPDRYRFVEHARYLDDFLDTVVADGKVTLVVHDWGSALGFYWAQRNAARVRGIAFMEAIVQPMTWQQWPEAARAVFEGFRSPAGEAMILENNLFVEAVLPGSVLRSLDDDEMEAYRRPFAEPGEYRRPTLSWPRQIPLDGEPEDVVAIVDGYGRWLAHADLPKLFINAEPGAILVGPMRDFVRSWPRLEEVTVRGAHFLQEDSPDEIGRAIAAWLAKI